MIINRKGQRAEIIKEIEMVAEIKYLGKKL